MLDVRSPGGRAGPHDDASSAGSAAPVAGSASDLIAVRRARRVDLDLRLEAVSEGVLVSGTVRADVVGECARCLEPFTDEITVEITELFAYPDSATDETTEEDEVPRVVDDHVDLEPPVRDARRARPAAAPLCRPDCPGLCAECGEQWADLAPDHGHETIDPRWAALRERLPAE